MTVKLELKPRTKRPYWIDVRPPHNWDKSAVWHWCIANFGHRNYRSDNPRWTANMKYSWDGGFKFRDEQDAMLFMMRWV